MAKRGEEAAQLEREDDPLLSERKEIAGIIARGEAADLLGYGAEAIARFEDRSSKATALMMCLQSRRWDLAEALVEAHPEQASRRCALYDWHPLHYAAAGAPAALIGKILKLSKADPDTVNSHGLTPLAGAAGRGHLEGVKALLEAGASVEGNPAGHRPIGLAAARNDAAMVKFLAEAGADVNAKSPEGKTPMMLAAAANCSEAIRELIALGADKAALDNFGKMALDIAKAERSKEAQAALGDGKAKAKPAGKKPAAKEPEKAKAKPAGKKPAAKDPEKAKAKPAGKKPAAKEPEKPAAKEPEKPAAKARKPGR